MSDNATLKEVYNQYIFNDVPTYLIDITDLDNLKLMDRFAVQERFQDTIKNIVVSDEDANPNNPDREENLLNIVKNVVRYAIFSHRWGQGPGNQEPTFTDISGLQKMDKEERNKLQETTGYKKLRSFCQKANDMGCTLAWSDTCCIDKRSSADLDENIRSMFRFYRNSHICIAYLADSTGLKDLLKDVWFTRGWTLQELVAPSRLKFFIKGWEPLNPTSENDKVPDAPNGLLAQLSEITTIPINDLLHFKPGTDRVSEKMSWAANRTTTRIEDIAYSLIGIFDVSLMVAYGEGKRAFFRLMEAILQRYNKWDVFAWKGQCSPYNNFLPSSPACYPTWAEPHRRRILQDGQLAITTADQYDHDYEVGYRSFSLTNSGLYTRLFIIRVDLADRGQTSEGLNTLTFYQANSDIQNVVVECKKLPLRAQAPKAESNRVPLKDHAPQPEWALAILDSWIMGGVEGFIENCEARSGGPLAFTAILLSFNPELGQWEKEMTENILKVYPTRPVNGGLTELYL